MRKADVVICGAGLAGCLAAISAGRQGAKVLLLEKDNMLGGIAAKSFMNSMTNFFFMGNDQQVIRGIPDEIVRECVRRGGISKYWDTNEYRQIRYDIELFHQVLLEKLWEEEVDIYTNTWATKAVMKNNTVTGVVAHTRGGDIEIGAKIVIDTTGDLEILDTADHNSYQYDNPGSATLLFELINVDIQKTFEYFLSNPDNYDENIDVHIKFDVFKKNWLERGMFHLPHFGGHALQPLQNAVNSGVISREMGLAKNCDAMAMFGNRESGRMLINSNFFAIDELHDIESFSRAELSARKICLTLHQALKEYFPGFDKSEITHVGTGLGSRRTRYLKGNSTTKTLEHAQRCDDVIGAVPVKDTSAKNGFFADDYVDIAYGTIVPERINNLLVGSGKCMSAEWKARHYLRLQPICMLIGQAAGVAAAVAVQTNHDTQSIDIKSIQKALLHQKAWLGNEKRLAELGLSM